MIKKTIISFIIFVGLSACHPDNVEQSHVEPVGNLDSQQHTSDTVIKFERDRNKLQNESAKLKKIMSKEELISEIKDRARQCIHANIFKQIQDTSKPSSGYGGVFWGQTGEQWPMTNGT